MSEIQISFKTKEMEAARSINYDMPETLADLTAKFGEDAVADAAKGAFVISLQALARRHLGKTDAEITELAAAWTPGERSPAVKKTAKEKAASAFAAMSAEERAEFLRRAQAGEL